MYEKIINVASSRRYFSFRRAKFDANNGLFKENLVKYKGKRTSQDIMFIVFHPLNLNFTRYLVILLRHNISQAFLFGVKRPDRNVWATKRVKKTMSKRIIGTYTEGNPGPLLICIGGIHGNELAGVQALKRIFELINEEPSKNHEFAFYGTLVGLRGNITALNKKQRYITKDLNRQWASKNVQRILQSTDNELDAEDKELKALHACIRECIDTYEPTKLILMDLHTTTAHGGIFSIATDDRDSQVIASELHAPVVRGLLNGIDGTTLHYFNTKNIGINTVAVCFESGQHDDLDSIDNAVAAIINCLRSVGCVEPQNIENKHDERLLKYSANLPKITDLIYCHDIHEGDNFEMKPGYYNFQFIKKDELLAHDKNGEIRSKDNALILMPLYQKQGNDGFFLIKKVEDF